MIDPFYIFSVIVVIGIFYIVPILIIFYLYKFLKRKSNNKIANIILTFLLIMFFYISYADLYPLEKSYSRNFKEKTELNFPKSTKYLKKISANSIFDFGGRMYCSKIVVNDIDYEKLNCEIENSEFIKVDNYTEDFDSDKIFSKIKKNEIEKIFRKRTSFDEYYIIYLSDKKTLILFYRSW